MWCLLNFQVRKILKVKVRRDFFLSIFETTYFYNCFGKVKIVEKCI